MMKHSMLPRCAAAMALLCVSAAAEAQSIPGTRILPVAEYVQLVEKDGFADGYSNPYRSLQIDRTGNDVGFDGMSATVAVGSVPSVTASAASGLLAYGFPDGSTLTPPRLTQVNHVAISNLKYYFAVAGPLSAIVPLTATFKAYAIASDSIRSSSPSHATASGYIGGDAVTASGQNFIGADSRYGMTGQATVSFSLSTNGTGDVELYTDVAAIQTDLDDVSYAEAYVDPYIQIDPAWAAANPGYSLQLSDGVGNANPADAGAVPEPAAWVLMALGFGIVGSTLRGRRRFGNGAEMAFEGR